MFLILQNYIAAILQISRNYRRDILMRPLYHPQILQSYIFKILGSNMYYKIWLPWKIFSSFGAISHIDTHFQACRDEKIHDFFFVEIESNKKLWHLRISLNWTFFCFYEPYRTISMQKCSWTPFFISCKKKKKKKSKRNDELPCVVLRLELGYYFSFPRTDCKRFGILNLIVRLLDYSENTKWLVRSKSHKLLV